MIVHVQTAAKQANEAAMNCMKVVDVMIDEMVIDNMNKKRREDGSND